MKKNLDFIRSVFSEPINQVEIIENGFHSIAYIINNQYVFRFPRSKEFYQEYENEVLILNRLKPYISIQVPHLKIHKTEDVLFTEHAYIAGIQYRQLLTPLNEMQKDVLAYDLAFFLKQLHDIKMSDIPYLPTEFQFDENMVQKCSVLTAEEKIKCLKLSDYFQQYTSVKQNIVLCHTDLNENNFLLNKNKLVGIIDFGNTCQREVSTEFSALLKYDFELVLRIVAHYQYLTGRKVDMNYAVLFQKMRCYDGIIENQNDLNQVNRYRRWLTAIEKHENQSLK